VRYRDISQTAVEHSVDGLVVIDADGIVQFANPAAFSLFGGKTGSLVGFQLGSPAIDAPVEIVVPSGIHTRYVEMRASEIVWKGQPASLASLRDITDRKQAEEEIRARAEELRERNAELTRLMRAAAGREARMIELKREVNELCERLGERPRHLIHDCLDATGEAADDDRQALRLQSLAALNLMEDAVAARKRAEQAILALHGELRPVAAQANQTAWSLHLRGPALGEILSAAVGKLFPEALREKLLDLRPEQPAGAGIQVPKPQVGADTVSQRPFNN
jgi:hypothetical protein